MSSQFPDQHRSMISIAQAIIAVAKGKATDSAAATRLTHLRLALSREVSEHCGAEIALLNARRAPQDARSVALVRQYHDDLLKWRHDLISCNAEWPPRRVFAEPDAFLRRFVPIADALSERVRWEEKEFYPAVLYDRAA